MEFALRGYGWPITCARCGLTGGITKPGKVRWWTPGRVGYLDREKTLAKAAEWNALVAALRETPTLIAIVWLRERVSPWRVLAVVLVAAGAIEIKSS